MSKMCFILPFLMTSCTTLPLHEYECVRSVDQNSAYFTVNAHVLSEAYNLAENLYPDYLVVCDEQR